MANKRQPKAVIYSSQTRNADGSRTEGFRFRLVGTNGEKLGASEHYTRKEKAVQTLTKYFPAFKVVEEGLTSNIRG